jgi:phenol hydroxylase P3 protein
MDTTVTHPAMSRAQHLSAMTTDLSWTLSHQSEQATFPALHAEGIQVHNWSAWQAPLQKTVEAYWHMQGEKDKRLYAITDAFAQNNGQLGVSDARYVNAIKWLMQVFTPIEYCAHRGHARVSRQLGVTPLQTQSMMQSLDHLRHQQIETHALSHFNKYFNGMHSFPEWFDNHWFLAFAKSYADDLLSAGPYEFLVAMALGYNQVVSPVLHVPFMSAAADNGDMSTASAGFSAATDKVQHQTAPGPSLDRQMVLAQCAPVQCGCHHAGLHAAHPHPKLAQLLDHLCATTIAAGLQHVAPPGFEIARQLATSL